MKSSRYKGKRTKVSELYNNLEAKFSVMERAGRVLERLASEYPCFSKCMLPSNVAHGYWLILPKKFCNLHFPRHDATVMLVDEWGNEHKTSFLLVRHGLSAGWRRFAIIHRLMKGDILVFHLVGPCKLKIHIERVYGLDAALSLMNLVTFGRRDFKKSLARLDNKRTQKQGKKRSRPLSKYLERMCKNEGLRVSTSSDDNLNP